MTFSLIARCEKTNMFGVVISSSSISVASRCPWVRAGTGAAATQNVTDPSLGNLMLDYLEQGMSPQDVINKIKNEKTNIDYRQLLLIDSSGSMNTKDKFSSESRMDKVKEALLLPNVQKAFFPMGGKNLVSIYEFTDGGAKPLGGKPILIDNIKDYRKLIKKHLRVSSGYTHMYKAVEFALEKINDEDGRIGVELIDREAVPTIVLLTDGFNNEKTQDTCESNAPKLQKLLEKIYKSRGNKDVDIRYRPAIYTVGLGKAFLPKFRIPSTRLKVNSRTLCGKYQDSRIDGGLEKKGIDNSSLTWIAEVGGGTSFLKQNAKGLGEAFAEAASVRYSWFELRYRVNPLLLRREFESRLVLKTFAIADSKITIYPHSLLDSPAGDLNEKNWSTPPKYGMIFATKQGNII